MRLLITTQAVDREDPALGFFHGWLEELATRSEALEVVCLYEGAHVLPSNVHIHTLGKERGARGRLTYMFRFYRTLWELRGRYDAIFVHMNPEYIVLAGPYWRLMGKRVLLWYTHRNVDLKLRIALLFASVVATAAPESLRIKNRKVRVVGHGIDAKAFATPRDGALHDPPALITVGRITPIKRLEILIEALGLLGREGERFTLTVVGVATVPGDQAYEKKLREQIHAVGVEEAVRFAGALSYEDMPAAYVTHDISINLAPTGGIDKAVLESMAAGAIPLVANRAFIPLLGVGAGMLVTDGTAADLAARIKMVLRATVAERLALAERLCTRVRKEADRSVIIGRLLAFLTS